MQLAYLGALLFSMAGMIVLDWRHRLAWWCNPVATAVTLTIGVSVFILWDIVGIMAGIFYSGRSPYMSGIYLLPELPIEELVFLLFLCYFTLVIYRLGERRWRPTS